MLKKIANLFSIHLQSKLTFLIVFSLALLLIGCANSPLGGLSSEDTSADPVAGSPVGDAAATAGYEIGPEDRLAISVWGEEDLQRTVLVRPDGGISFPLAGDLQAAGKTPNELQQEITQRLQKYIPEPFVTVSVETVAGYKVYVLGQVNSPGEFPVGRYVDVLQALSLAGGLTPFASEDRITIRRRQNGREVVLPFSYSAASRGGDSAQNIILRSGDTVVVP